MATSYMPDNKGKSPLYGAPQTTDFPTETRSGQRSKKRMRFMDFALSLYSRFEDDEVPAMGAQLTYYLILSFFPFLIFVIAVLGFTNMTAQDAINSMTRLLPDMSIKTMLDAFQVIQNSRSGSLLSIGLLATLWSASNGINAVIKALNKAYDVEEKRPYWKVKGLSIIATIVMAFVILCSFIMLVFGQIIGEAIYKFVRLPGSFDTIWSFAQYIVPLIVITVVFMLLYKYVPNLHLKFKEVVPGAIFSTLGWVITSLLFSFYVNNFGNYTKTYGSIGGIIVLLTWLYLSSIIIILGGEINATLHFDRNGKQKHSSKKFSISLFGKKKKQEEDDRQASESKDGKPLYL